jgi:phosphoglycolate phosphatase
LIDANTAVNAEVDFAAVLTGTTAAEDFIALPNVCIAGSLTEILRTISKKRKTKL